MQAITDILVQLGLNKTAAYQLVFFLIAYYFLSQFLFKPYLKILHLRHSKTGGSLEETTSLMSEAEKLSQEYHLKVKAHNEQANDEFLNLRKQALAEQDKALQEARATGAQLIEKNRVRIAEQVKKATDQLKSHSAEFSTMIAARVLGREIK